MSIRSSYNHSVSNDQVTYGHLGVARDPKEKSHPFLVICPECGMMEAKKRWFHDATVLESKKVVHEERLCPGCEAIKNGWIEGEVELRHDIAKIVPSQIESFIKNIEEHYRWDDPKNRIVKIQKFKNMWRVYTASFFLARMIGEHLEKQNKSKTTYRFGRGQKYVYVVWE